MKITPVEIGDKIELYGEIFGSKIDDLNLTAQRLTFKEITNMFKKDEVGGGFCTLTLGEAKRLYIDLGIIIKELEG